VFHIILDERVNDRYVWTNGKEYLSYVKHDDEKLDKDLGTWIIGSEPGEDNGYVYLRVNNTHTLSPIGLDGDGVNWNWLSNKSWKEQPQMRVVCVDKYAPTARYYEVEYFDPVSQTAHNSFLVTDFSPYMLIEQETKQTVGLDYELPESLAANQELISVFLDANTHEWRPIRDLTTLLTYGSPYAFTAKVEGQSSFTGVLINDEHAGGGAWRLTFRKYHFTGTERQQFLQISDDDECLVEIDNNGIRATNATIARFSDEQQQEFARSVRNYIYETQPGDYLWLWLSDAKVEAKSFNYSEYLSSDITTKTDELLVRCVSRLNNTLLFQLYPTDRMDAMRQTILQADTDLFTIRFDGSSNDNSAMQVLLGQKEMSIHSVFPIGKKQVVSFLRRYIETKEGRPNGMSSCYMYHAAASMPQALLYATEILCVLLGYKPLTLIQYSSPSEHQWKFPMVRELSQSIVAAKMLLGDQLDVGMRKNKYRDDETLVFYRSAREYVNQGLLPKFESQALHPLPYPDSEKPEPDWKLQIFNAWWNGVMLGYPEYFVDSYCESFHNGLSQDERVVQMRHAKASIVRYLQSIGKSLPVIGRGMEPPIDEAHFQLIADMAQS